ncbi:TIGR02594 family protein [Candidatus Pacearchaeota archaeon]|nr:TIGR02594 family protein [Candidatus Pacearchaeota archaeon]
MEKKKLAEFLQKAFEEMNVKEIKGKNHNPRILQYHNSTNLRASTDEIPWCSSYANFVVIKCGVEGTKSAMARSFETWGDPLAKPIPGCVVVLKRGPDTTKGHVNFYLYETKKYIYCIGGNQGDAVSIARFPKSSVVCYRG